MAARPFWRALSITVVLGALSVGFTAAQDSPSSIVDSTGAPADHGSSDTTSPTQEVDVASTANDPTNPDTSIKMVGTPFPLRLDPAGYRIGPIHLTNVSTSGFYSIAAPVGQSSQTLVGTSIGGNFVYTHPVANGMVAIQANPTVYISPGSAYVNSIGGVDFQQAADAPLEYDRQRPVDVLSERVPVTDSSIPAGVLRWRTRAAEYICAAERLNYL